MHSSFFIKFAVENQGEHIRIWKSKYGWYANRTVI